MSLGQQVEVLRHDPEAELLFAFSQDCGTLISKNLVPILPEYENSCLEFQLCVQDAIDVEDFSLYVCVEPSLQELAENIAEATIASCLLAAESHDNPGDFSTLGNLPPAETNEQSIKITRHTSVQWLPKAPYLLQSVSGSQESLFTKSWASLDISSDPFTDRYSYFEQPEEDGPLFRARLEEMGKRSLQLRNDLKQTGKLGNEVLESQQAWVSKEIAFLQAFKPLARDSTLQIYFEFSAKRLQMHADSHMQQVRALLIEPLRILNEKYERTLESLLKNFQQESSEYYSYVTKYLGVRQTENRRKSADVKYFEKRFRFENLRYDYFYQLVSILEGEEIIHHVINFAEKYAMFYSKVAENVAQLNPVISELEKSFGNYIKSCNAIRKIRNERKKQIALLTEKKAFHDAYLLLVTPLDEEELIQICEGSSIIMGRHSRSESAPVFPGLSTDGPLSLSIRPSSNSIHSVGSMPKKEGFLFLRSLESVSSIGMLQSSINAVTSTTNMLFHQGKLWCVLSGGYLFEYTNWKRHLELHEDPIPLKLVNVKKTQNKDIRFGFDLISPNFKRTYQAINQEELDVWIREITKTVEYVISNHTTESLNANLPSMEIIDVVQLQSLGNNVCADCGTNSPEWCSINLGILLCIGSVLLLILECSAVHRGLGTHISKVRSLLLDTRAFTRDAVALFLNLGNNAVNEILEHSLNSRSISQRLTFIISSKAKSKLNTLKDGTISRKPQPSDSRETKAAFINAKYIDKQFMVDNPQARNTNSLLESVGTGNCAAILNCILEKTDISSWHAVSAERGGNSSSNAVGKELHISPLCVALFSDRLRFEGPGYLKKVNLLKKGQPLETMVQAIRLLSLTHNRSVSAGDVHLSAVKPVEKQEEAAFPTTELLLLNGANPNVVDGVSGLSLHKFAILLDDSEILEYLMRKGIKDNTIQ